MSFLETMQMRLLAARGLNASHLMGLTPGDVHIDRALTNLLVAYENREYVADKAMPVVQVQSRSDRIFSIPVATMQQIASSELASNRGKPGEASFSITSGNYSVRDYALMDFVSNATIANADAPLQPKMMTSRVLKNYLSLGREVRVAAKVFSNSNYSSSHSALAGGARWDTDTSDPVADILAAIESCFVRPNVMVLGAQVYNALRVNPKVAQYILNRAATTAGPSELTVNTGLLAQMFDLDEVIVGRAKYNSAAEGQAVVGAYVWGKSCALIRREDPSAAGAAPFGYTFRVGGWITQDIPDLISGISGGSIIKVAHSDDENVIGGGNSGYLYETVIS